MHIRLRNLLVLVLCAGALAQAGEQIGPWLHLGPLALDVTKEFEHLQIYGLDRAGARLRADQDREALQFAAATPAEGDSASLFGQTSRWELLRLPYPSKLATWGQFGRFPVLLTNVLQTRISSAERRVRVNFEIAGGARIYLNGASVFRYDWPSGRYAQRRHHQVDLDLRDGENNLVVVIFAIHLHAANAFYAESETPVKTSVKWRDQNGRRAEVEKDLARIYVGPWLARSGNDTITAGIEGPPSRFTFQFRSGLSKYELPAGKTSVVLGSARDLFAGRGSVAVTARSADGLQVRGPEFALQRAEPPPDVDSKWTFEQRRKYILTKAAQSPAPARRALARAALGQKIALTDLAEALNHVNQRIDTADFVMHDLMRLFYQFPDALAPEVRDAIKAAALGWKYWLDEPGSSSMFMKSENHQILFHTLQYLTGNLFPADTFREIGAPGTVQSLKGRILANEWMQQRMRFGFEEWLAPGYLEKDVQAMLNLYDNPGDDGRLGPSAQSVLDLIFTYLLSHEWGGYMHTTAGRAYMREVTTPHMQHVASLVWLLTGKGVAEVDSGAVALALSTYRPPEAILALSKPGAPSITYAQQGRDRNGAGVNTITLRSATHMLSTTLDLQKGSSGPQAHIMQATLPGGVPVFINSAVSTSEVTRPGYWLGNTELPRALQYRDTAILLYRLKDSVAFTHCFFPLPWMDRHIERGKWIAAQKGDGFVAVYSSSGQSITRSGPYRHFEMVAAARDNVWIVKVGSRTEYPTLDAFAAALPEPSFDSGVVSVGPLRASWDGPFTNNGSPIPVKGFPMIGNEWVKSEFGSGIVSIVKPGATPLSIWR